MATHKFTITIKGERPEAEIKALALAVLGSHLSAQTLSALAKVVREDPAKVALAKQFLGVS